LVFPLGAGKRIEMPGTGPHTGSLDAAGRSACATDILVAQACRVGTRADAWTLAFD